MKPALAALSVLIFTFIWNDYFWAVVLTQGENAQPVTAGITSFNCPVPRDVSLDERGLACGRPAPCCDVLFDAKTLHRRPDLGRCEMKPNLE